MYRSILKISIIPLVSFGNVTMGCDYNNKEFAAKLIILKPDRIKNLAPETMEDLIDYLDNPIVFGQTDKENHGLVKHQGLRNICLAYEKKDPNFFLSHYVPVLCIDRSRSRDRWKGFFISPYKILFDAGLDRQGDGKKIVELEKKRVDYTIEKWVEEQGLSSSHLDYTGWILEDDHLVRVALFGSDEDISKELNRKISTGGPMPMFLKPTFLKLHGNRSIIQAIQACIKYPNKTNNALSLLLSTINTEAYFDTLLSAIDTEAHWDDIRKGESFYELLLLADKLKNKEAFALLVSNDPYNVKNLIWEKLSEFAMRRCYGDGEKIAGTNLDHMLREGNFDQENIATYIKHGGKTMKKIREEEMQALAEEQRRKVQRKESPKDKECTLF
ncbi:MAG TPA: hypothetical protein VKR54_01885 [Candidatus Babeliales bacterium]|jgi:hypothetical protein|nr:hypothetical protein [Candidatus Babeliales bacterium]